MPGPTLTEILRALHTGNVDFILAGGLAAVILGAPLHTWDVDIVHSREPANIARLLAVLESLQAIFRLQAERRLKPNESHLSGTGHVNLQTRCGPLDALCTIGENLGYEELLPHAKLITVAEDLQIRVLDLETIIAIKERLGGEKDRAALPLLRRTLEERRKLGLS